MKKTLLTVMLATASFITYSQVICAGVTPASIAVNYQFEWADPADLTWSTPDFLIPATFIEDTLMIADDGTLGLSAQGISLGNYGCIPLTNDLTGKIAIVYRYDGATPSTSCEFGVKALACQAAGAIGVIIVNRVNEAVGMSGGAEGLNVTIPVVMISSVDGAILRAEMANGAVVMFIGNKFGIFSNDIGSDPSSVILATQGSTPSILAQNAGELTFNPGIQMVNYGLTTQTDVYVTATIDAPGTPAIYSQVVGPLTLNYTDTMSIFAGNPVEFPAFSLATYPIGEYTLTYSISLGNIVDESPYDNAFTSTFYVTDDIFSYARFDAVADEPVVTSYPKNHDVSYRSCIRFNDVNASRAGVLGMSMALNVDTSLYELQAQDIALYAYQWDDLATTFSATPTFDLLVDIAYASFNPTASYTNGDQIFIPFLIPIILEDNRNYLFCVETQTQEPSFGYDGSLNYGANLSINDNVIFPIHIVNSVAPLNTWYGAGWNGNPAPSIGLKLFPAAELGILETSKLEGLVYPNPASGVVTISMNADGAANLTVTDVTGKIALQSALSLVNGKSDVNITALEAGIYFFNVTLENGQTSQFKIVKK